MKLLLRRSQRAAGISGNVIFCLDARVEFTADERQNILRYKLQNQVLYNSEASQRALDRAEAAKSETSIADWRHLGSLAKSLAFTALAAMRLNVSIRSLQEGQHIECKSLDELLGAEDAILEACKNLRLYLEAAASFDGREVLVDFSSGEPEVVAQAPALPALAASSTPAALTAPAAGPLEDPSAHSWLPAPAPSASPLPQYELVDSEAVPVRSEAHAAESPAQFRGLYSTAARSGSSDDWVKPILIIAGLVVVLIWVIVMRTQLQIDS